MSVLGAVFIHKSQNQGAIHARDFNITTFVNLNFNSLHEVLWSGLIQYQIGCIVVTLSWMEKVMKMPFVLQIPERQKMQNAIA